MTANQLLTYGSLAALGFAGWAYLNKPKPAGTVAGQPTPQDIAIGIWNTANTQDRLAQSAQQMSWTSIDDLFKSNWYGQQP